MPVIAGQTNEVVVFQFAMYDIRSDEIQTSTRWATQDFIDKFGVVVVGVGAGVDSSLVDAEGLTERGFDPGRTAGGFQTEVRSHQRP